MKKVLNFPPPIDLILMILLTLPVTSFIISSILFNRWLCGWPNYANYEIMTNWSIFIQPLNTLTP